MVTNTDLDQPLVRVCRDCGEAFDVAPELPFLQALARELGRAFFLPSRCRRCRSERRRLEQTIVDDGEPELLTCVHCGAPFVFADEEKQYFVRRGWFRPRRCRAHRRR